MAIAQTQQTQFDEALIRRYDRAGPRYTSYPTAVQFHEGFTAADYQAAALATNARGNPLSLYFHLPFCDTVCFYCACNKIATKDREMVGPYLDRVYRELALQAERFDGQRPVTQLHWGGGTPTFISHAQMRELMRVTGEHFKLLDQDQGEYSVEIDPRETDADTIDILREIGFNRMSLGVQDLDPRVQEAVNRVQSEDKTFRTLEQARTAGFRSISIDLMYGLPHQSAASFAKTVDRILEVRPDRFSVFNYAHLPERFMPQRRINPEDLPSPAEKLAILADTTERITAAGYVYIGMDHFAHPDDELAIAQREGTLYRNFQGYSTHSDCDLIGIGVTSVGMVGNTYSQNQKELEAYYAELDAGRLPILRGVQLDEDDILRRKVITELICHFRLRFAMIEQRFGIDFHDYFRDAMEELKPMADDGLIELSDDGITVTPAGRLLIRNICMPFDKYLRQASEQRFSKVI